MFTGEFIVGGAVVLECIILNNRPIPNMAGILDTLHIVPPIDSHLNIHLSHVI